MVFYLVFTFFNKNNKRFTILIYKIYSTHPTNTVSETSEYGSNLIILNL
jgi:hypothetical protein